METNYFVEVIEITSFMTNKVPKHFQTFPEDAHRDLSVLTKENYEVPLILYPH